jgi:hypothetical protein
MNLVHGLILIFSRKTSENIRRIYRKIFTSSLEDIPSFVLFKIASNPKYINLRIMQIVSGILSCIAE